MALTREFKDTVKARAARDPDFREELLIAAAEQLLAGDLKPGKPCSEITSMRRLVSKD
jgi:hypothetical protein